ncbi:MAG: hypothetical protein V7607_1718 [Solirubrobacteraceae bacterium]
MHSIDACEPMPSAALSRSGRLRRAPAVLVCTLLLLLGFQAAAAEAFSCRNNKVFTLQSAGNKQWVSAELGWTGESNGLLRARAAIAGPWERFRMFCSIDHAFRSVANGKWVAAELSWSWPRDSLLRARTTTTFPGPWEWFQFHDSGVGPDGRPTVAIYNVASDSYVSAELGWGKSDHGLLRARAAYPRGWERFYLTYE